MSGLSPTPAPVSLPDEHSNYECFVSDIQTDFELRVEAVQRTADENTKVYESYSNELKKQLKESLCANQHLEECCTRLQEAVSCNETEKQLLESKLAEAEKRVKDQEMMDNTIELLRSMTGLNVTQIETSRNTTTYTCVVVDGRIKDHQFCLSLDKLAWEFTYKPLSSVAVSDGTFDLNSINCFPDYMISRFLANLLKLTHS